MRGVAWASGRGERFGVLRPLRTRAALAALVASCLIGCARGCALAASDPVAQILAPQSGGKIRQGQTADVTIRVDGSAQVAWVLSLQGVGSAASTLASGSGVVSSAPVARIYADTLVAGASPTA